MSGRIAPYIVTNGLIMYLDAANPASYTVGKTDWYDLTINRNNGSGSFSYDSSNFGSIVFNGSTDSVEFESIGNLFQNSSQNLTWCFALKYLMTVPSDKAKIIFNAFETGWDGGRPLGLYNNPSNGITSFYAGLYINQALSIRADAIGSTAIPLNTWVQVTYTWDGSNYSIYVNGSEISYFSRSSSISTNYSTGAEPVAIGRDILNVPQNVRFDGHMSVAMIYNRKLELNEIQQNYNVLRRRYNL